MSFEPTTLPDLCENFAVYVMPGADKPEKVARFVEKLRVKKIHVFTRKEEYSLYKRTQAGKPYRFFCVCSDPENPPKEHMLPPGIRCKYVTRKAIVRSVNLVITRTTDLRRRKGMYMIYDDVSKQDQMSSSTDAVIQTVEPEFIHEGTDSCCPIPGDGPNIKSAEFPTIKAIDGTKKEGDKYDQSSNAQKMMKGGGNYGQFTHISIPFSSSSRMKGAYICLYPSTSHLIFTLTSSKGEKASRKYKFPEFETFHWYFLSVDLPDVVLCEITGKGREEECYKIESLVFISREETPEEIKSREAREKLWSEAPVVKTEFIKEGDIDCIPIGRDDPKVVDPSFSVVKCKIDGFSKEFEEYDQSSRAQRMLKGEFIVGSVEGGLWLSHLSIPFPSPSPMKGAYICVEEDMASHSSPSLLFTFTDCDGKKTSKKYEFTEPEHQYEWHFLPIDLDNVVLCEIEGKGTWCDKNSRYFAILSLVFISREETPEELKSREAREKIWSETPIVKPEFVKKGDKSYGYNVVFDTKSIPIPRDDPKVVDPSFSVVKCKNDLYSKESEKYDMSSKAQKMLKGEEFEWEEEDELEDGDLPLSHLSIPFPSPSPMKGAYICVEKYDSSPSLLFTFTDCDGKKTSKKYAFTEPEHYYEWFFLPIDLCNVVLCEIEGKGTWLNNNNSRRFFIHSLVFIRKETPKELKSREAREKIWSETPIVKPEFVKEGGRDSIPIPRDDPKVVDPSFSVVKCKNDLYSKESEKYDMSSKAQKMLKGEEFEWEEEDELKDGVLPLSHLSIPFPSPSPMKGAYICVEKYDSSPSLLFTFTDCDGKKTSKKYEFTRPKHYYEWHFLPIDLYNVVLCEIEGKITREEESYPLVFISSLVFLRGDDIPTSPPLPLPLPLPCRAISPYTVPPDSVTLTPTSPSTITPQCIIGSGGFGDVIFAHLMSPYFPIPAVLCAVKCMKNASTHKENVHCVKRMKEEFVNQCKLYSKPSLQSCIPRPLHMLDFLDDDLKGTFGLAMEFCQGGNVMEFAKSWAVNVNEDVDEDEDEDDPEYDPVKIAALCVAIIECVATLFDVKKKLVHRDIKPDNFLVRYNALKKQCHVLLGDLGFVEIRESMSRSSFITKDSSSSSSSSSSDGLTFEFKTSIVGTLCYSAPESLSSGFYCQRSDVWGVVLTIWSLFNDMKQPFMSIPTIRSIPPSPEYDSILCSRLCKLASDPDRLPQLTDSEIFCSLETMEDGKYNAVYKAFLEVFHGMLNPNRFKRMTIHQAHSLTRELKHILPRVGEGWECPSIEEYIADQLEEYDGCTGTIHSSSSSSSSSSSCSCSSSRGK
ncbi:hypothetical protein ADUPG1_013399 [Aduncisulcus paluster]|uniref:Protein kinase domain-containing protein n=1 Tax=Aduncisulcus paluster TaxID=2918883 RepID=A0ABQ5K6X5_9EUKA|nr:hypothetical protein ADUPG1_013399 [Aduncisulcus paluster]